MRPVAVKDVTSLSGTLRLLVDVQLLGIVRSLRAYIAEHGSRVNAVLDLGCGEQPFRKLFSTKSMYLGLDVPKGFSMSHSHSNIVFFDGSQIPIRSASLDCVLATEVLEHVKDVRTLLQEVSRVLRSGGQVFCTTPWSARLHYEPLDFQRISPHGMSCYAEEAGLELVRVEPRGNLASVISNKLLVSLLEKARTKPVWSLAILGVLPILIPVHVWGLVLTLCRKDSKIDPLGFTYLLQKPQLDI
jgi:SAM-dependent methyltransferase